MSSRKRLRQRLDCVAIIAITVGLWAGMCFAVQAEGPDIHFRKIVFQFQGPKQQTDKVNIRGILLLVLSDPASHSSMGLSPEQQQKVKAQIDKLGLLLNDTAAFPGSREMAHMARSSLGKSDQVLQDCLSPQQFAKLKGQTHYFAILCGASKELEQPRSLAVVRDDRFWKAVEKPSRQARRDAMEDVLIALDDDQINKLKELLSEEQLYASHVRNDVLYQQLVISPSPCKGGE